MGDASGGFGSSKALSASTAFLGTRLPVLPLPRVTFKPASKVLHLARPQGSLPSPCRLLRGTEPSDSDGSHTESGTFCASRRPKLISNRRRVPRHPHYFSQAQGLIALAVERLPRTRRTVGAGEALGRLASVSIYIYIYIYMRARREGVSGGPPRRRWARASEILAAGHVRDAMQEDARRTARKSGNGYW